MLKDHIAENPAADLGEAMVRDDDESRLVRIEPLQFFPHQTDQSVSILDGGIAFGSAGAVFMLSVIDVVDVEQGEIRATLSRIMLNILV